MSQSQTTSGYMQPQMAEQPPQSAQPIDVPQNGKTSNRYVHIDLVDGKQFKIALNGVNLFEAYAVVDILHEKLRTELGL